MGHATRRVILKPDGISNDQWAKLRAAVETALTRQAALATECVHILTSESKIEVAADALIITHESASAVSVDALFSPQPSNYGETELLSAAMAFAAAMSAAHGGDDKGAIVHGGVAPGILLVDEDGIWKIADFGIAPAISSSLGVDHYLNLAVGPPDSESPYADASAIWQVLPEEEADRDDRICAFIDPEKYIENTLSTFETGSDIIAAGFVLQLLAEHTHPYLSVASADAHRSVETARMLIAGAFRYSPFLRKDLTQNPTPALQAWCAAVDKMLEPTPSDRPSAESLVALIQPHAPKIDAEFILKSRAHKQAEEWIASVDAVLKGKDWDAIGKTLDSKPQLASWPDAIAQRLDQLAAGIAEQRAAQAKAAELDAQRTAAQKWFDDFEKIVASGNDAKAEKLAATKPSDNTAWPDGLLKKANDAIAALHRRAAERADQAVAEEWIKALEKLVAAADWNAASEHHNAKPDIKHWPKEITEQAKTLGEQIKSHLKEIEKSRAAVTDWITKASKEVDAGKFEQALATLSAKPDVPANLWPPEIRAKADELGSTARHALDAAKESLRQNVRDSLPGAVSAFVAAAITSAKLDKWIAPDAVTATVGNDQIQWDDSEPPSGQLKNVALAIKSASDAKLAHKLSTSFTTQNNKAAIKDDDAAAALAEALRQHIASAQQAAWDTLRKSVSSGLFPNAELNGDLKAPATAIEAQWILDSKDKQPPLPAKFDWNSQSQSWIAIDAAAVRKAATDAAVAALKKPVASQLAQSVKAIQPYKAIVSVKIDAIDGKSSDALLPAECQLACRIAITPPGAAQPRALHTLNVTCRQAGKAELGDLAACEQAVQSAIAEIQTASMAELLKTVEQKVNAAQVRLKTSTKPTAIKTPVDKIEIVLAPRRGDAATLDCKWNTEKLSIALPGDWQAKVDAIIEVAKQAPSGGKGKLIGIAAGVVVAAGIGVGVMMKGGGGGTGPTPNGSNNGGEVVTNNGTNTPVIDDGDRNNDTTTNKTPVNSNTNTGDTTGTTPNGNDPAMNGGPDKPDTNTNEAPPPPKPTALKIDAVASATTGKPFDVAVTILDDQGQPLAMTAPLKVTLTSQDGSSLSGTTSATVAAGSNKATFKGITVADANDALVLIATAPGFPDVESRPIRVEAPRVVMDTPKRDPIKDLAAALPALDPASTRAVAEFVTQISPIDAPPSAIVTAATAWIEGVAIAPLTADGDVVTINATFRTTDGLAPQTQTFSITMTDGAPSDLTANAEALDTVAGNILIAAAGEANRKLTGARLPDARAIVEKLRPSVAVLPNDPTANTFKQLLADRYPPPWAEVSAVLSQTYTNIEADADTDRDTGYPNEITATDATGKHLMRLVSVPPTDELWQTFQSVTSHQARLTDIQEEIKNRTARKWRIFYVDKRETAVDAAAIIAMRDAKGASVRRLPTRFEWMLAALKTIDRRNKLLLDDYLTNRFEWTREAAPGSDQVAWVCGGATAISASPTSRLNAKLAENVQTAFPDDGDMPAFRQRLWNWINGELATQPRLFGDRLAAARAIAPIYGVK